MGGIVWRGGLIEEIVGDRGCGDGGEKLEDDISRGYWGVVDGGMGWMGRVGEEDIWWKE